jgi:hypothetical protein
MQEPDLTYIRATYIGLGISWLVQDEGTMIFEILVNIYQTEPSD